MADAMIIVEHLSKQYSIGESEPYLSLRDIIAARLNPVRWFRRRQKRGKFWALHDVNFTVAKGEVLGVIGRNGAGKSTLLKIISQITPPTEGSIRLQGRVASLLEVGTGFHPELTGRENIFLNGSLLGMTKVEIKRKFDEIVDFSEVEKFLDMPVKHYSSGMYVRLAFAVAAHLDPEILIADEVLAVGDIQFQKKCLDRMKTVAGQGRTVIFVSHNMASIALLCDRVVLLQEGKVVAIGKTDDMINLYQSELVHQRIKISERTDRKGSGLLRVNDIQLEDLAGQVLLSPKVKQPVQFRVRTTSSTDILNKEVALNLILSDRNEHRIFALQNEIVGQRLVNQSKQMDYICQVPDGLPLLPGTYSLTHSILVNGILAEKMVAAFEFTITGDDIYGTNQLPPASMGLVIVNNQWNSRVAL